MLGWLSRDGKLLLFARPFQAFSASFVSLFIAVYLDLIGLPLWGIGLILSGGLLFATLFNLVTGFLADRVGRRRSMVFFGLLAALSGFVFAFTTSPFLLVPVAVASSLGYRGGFGPANMLERVILAQACPDERRTRMYAMRSTLNSLATSGGALFAGAVVLFQRWFGASEVSSYMWMFGIYGALNLVVAVLYSMLSGEAEVEVEEMEAPPLSPETRRHVLGLSLLFSMDSLGGGFLNPSLLSYWFFDRFGLGMDVVAVIFAVSNLLAALSFMVAAWVSERIGLIRTMVFSHTPANLLMMAVPYMPNLAASTAVYFGRSLLCQMDVPTRQSYVMAIVRPEERSRVAGLLNLPRSLVSALGPTIAGYVMQFMGPSLPFLFGGGIKVLYDVGLYLKFRNVKPPEELEVAA